MQDVLDNEGQLPQKLGFYLGSCGHVGYACCLSYLWSHAGKAYSAETVA
jgi:hypothetical protein